LQQALHGFGRDDGAHGRPVVQRRFHRFHDVLNPMIDPMIDPMIELI
jgi:hypothetical protein